MNKKIQDILDKGYSFPTVPFIGRTQDTKKLYDLEEKRNSAIRDSTQELGDYLNHEPTDFYKKTVGESLYSLLDSYDSRASTLVCVEFLKRQGIEIKE